MTRTHTIYKSPLSLFTSSHRRSILFGLMIVVGNLIFMCGVFGQTNRWTGHAMDNLWNSGGNWTIGVPTSAHNVLIDTIANILVNANPTIDSLTINNSATVSFTPTGLNKTITIGAGGCVIGSGSVLTLKGTVSSSKMTLAFSGTNVPMSIAGTLIITDVLGGSVFNLSSSITTVT
ncbi:MAG: hypothetical protein WBP41_03045, partial [Saprospiraceae bacterium]